MRAATAFSFATALLVVPVAEGCHWGYEGAKGVTIVEGEPALALLVFYELCEGRSYFPVVITTLSGTRIHASFEANVSIVTNSPRSCLVAHWCDHDAYVDGAFVAESDDGRNRLAGVVLATADDAQGYHMTGTLRDEPAFFVGMPVSSLPV